MVSSLTGFRRRQSSQGPPPLRTLVTRRLRSAIAACDDKTLDNETLVNKTLVNKTQNLHGLRQQVSGPRRPVLGPRRLAL